MYLKPTPKTLLLAATLTSAQYICTLSSIGIGIAPDTATSTYSLIVNSTCGLIDQRTGNGELCGTYNSGSEVTCENQEESGLVSVVTGGGEVFENCRPASEVCYEAPGYAILWCCGV